MPVTRSRTGLYDAGLDQTNTTRFLFGDEDSGVMGHGMGPDDSFPTLVRRDDQIVSLKPPFPLPVTDICQCPAATKPKQCSQLHSFRHLNGKTCLDGPLFSSRVCLPQIHLEIMIKPSLTPSHFSSALPLYSVFSLTALVS